MNQKTCLFIAPVFYDYHNLIKMEIEKLGYNVLFYPERKYGYVFKFFNNFSKKHLETYQNDHYSDILKRTSAVSIDLLFVIKGFKMPKGFVGKLRKRNENLKAIMYQWDSNLSNPYLHLVSEFDRVFSFDFKDSEDNELIAYKPLFYTSEIESIRKYELEETYDFFFIGDFKRERYEALISFITYCEVNNHSLQSFLFVPNTTLIREYFKGNKLKKSLLSSRFMSRDEYVKNLAASKVIVDVTDKRQTGLSMRCIEALGAGKKLLTNKEYIKLDPIFDESKICFFDASEPKIPSHFLEAESRGYAEGIEDYRLDKWVSSILANDA